MRYTLKDYQAEAVGEILDRLEDARAYMAGPKPVSTNFALSAPTGSGKTVIAARVIETLMFGSDAYPDSMDPNATVLWVSDSPSLNQQSMYRIEAASEKLTGRSEIIETDFVHEQLKPRKVYFINTQKLREGSILARDNRFSGDGNPDQLTLTPRPDGGGRSFYEILQNTIANPDTNLYVIIDEAHRGIQKSQVSNHKTILTKIISGRDKQDVQVPVVMGISATVKRFDEAMENASGRLAMENVTVDSELVQNSGLIKDTVLLGIPGETDNFDMALIGHGAEITRDQSQQWRDYHDRQLQMGGALDDEPVVPLLVVQVPNEPTDALLADVMRTVLNHWPELDADTAFAHVFGEHKDMSPGGFHLPYIEPQRVQDTHSVRVLIAMTAVTTGWDCPRAEVLVSLRQTKDPTPITQLLGRMIRTPLARRIEGNDVLNTVTCLLPHADEKVVSDVVRNITTGGSDLDPEITPKRVLFDPVNLHINDALGKDLSNAMKSLPAETIPAPVSHPVSRLIQFGMMLSADGIRKDASAEATSLLCRYLDGLSVTHKNALVSAEHDVRHLNVRKLSTDVRFRTAAEGDASENKVTFDESFVELQANAEVIRRTYRRQARVLSSHLSGEYLGHLVDGDTAEIDDDDLLEGFIRVAALSKVEKVVEEIYAVATRTANEWFSEHHSEISGLNDQRRQSYEVLRAQDAQPQRREIIIPEISQADRQIRYESGLKKQLPTSTTHLLCDEEGLFPYAANELETRIITTEVARDDHVGWYRNPARGGQASLSVAYQLDGRWRGLYPDFVFFNRNADGSLGASIVDPHSTHLSDALPKLKGLARFAEEYQSEFRRILAVDTLEGKEMAIDLLEEKNRHALLSNEHASAAQAFLAIGIEYK